MGAVAGGGVPLASSGQRLVRATLAAAAGSATRGGGGAVIGAGVGGGALAPVEAMKWFSKAVASNEDTQKWRQIMKIASRLQRGRIMMTDVGSAAR